MTASHNDVTITIVFSCVALIFGAIVIAYNAKLMKARDELEQVKRDIISLRSASELAYDQINHDMQINKSLHDNTIDELRKCRERRHERKLQ